jgi:hypothetical protein
LKSGQQGIERRRPEVPKQKPYNKETTMANDPNASMPLANAPSKIRALIAVNTAHKPQSRHLREIIVNVSTTNVQKNSWSPLAYSRCL